MKKLKGQFNEILTTAVMFIGIFAFCSSVAEPYFVPTGSMEPTILPGDRLIVLKAAYDVHIPFTKVKCCRWFLAK